MLCEEEGTAVRGGQLSRPLAPSGVPWLPDLDQATWRTQAPPVLSPFSKSQGS